VKQPEETAPPSRDVPGVVEHLFRHEAGKVVATLTRSSAWNTSRWPRTWCRRRGTADLAFNGVPEYPSAWIMRTSRNLALDVVRRVSKWHYGRESM
jgi:predicted RNA polymerase sigma factor